MDLWQKTNETSSPMLPPLTLMIVVGILLLYCRGAAASFALTAGLFLLSGLLSIAYFAADYFTGEGVTDAVLFHLVAGPEGAGVLGFTDLLVQAGLALAGLLVFLAVAIRRFRRAARQRDISQAHVPVLLRSLRALAAPVLACVSLAVHPATIDGMTLWSQYRIESETDISQFVQPVELAAAPRPHKNLVYLYLESLERTYFDESKFPGLIRNLRELEKDSVSFHGLRQAPMTGWTIAGMTASQCGIPMSTFNVGANRMGERKRFLPGATCMGDLLKNEGYHLTYVGGADLNFAGKGNFYTTHGFDEIIGLEEMDVLTGGKLPKSKWGMYDDTTLDVVYQKFEQLSQTGRPFGLFSLTLDTHPPSGHATPACGEMVYGDGENKMLNAVHCADHLVGHFIRKIRSSQYAESTILVVGSDHLVMNSDATLLIQAPGALPRNNLLLLFDTSAQPGIVNRVGTTLDVAPTVLSQLGYQIDEFAMGRNLFGKGPTMVEKYGFDVFAGKVERWRTDLWKYWNPPQDKQADNKSPAIAGG